MISLAGFLTGCILLCSNVLASEDEAFQCHELEHYDASSPGEIKSPFYGNDAYPDNLWCEYKISAPENYRIKITFLDLDIEPTGSCGTDKLVVYGADKESILGIFCGHDIPNPLISHEDENEVRLLFQTDYMVGGRGFRLRYESAPHMDLCAEDEGNCRNRNCYKEEKHCDGVDDCGDGTDEEDCGNPIALLSDECGETPIKPHTIYGGPDRMVGGEAAVPNSWPWQVSIQRANVEPNGHFCGGTLISPQWVVSAAHCFMDNPFPASIRVTIGSHNKYSKTKFELTRVAEKIISYPDLEGEKLRQATNKHDIALIKLNAPVTFSDGVQPACLPHLGWEVKHGWKCYTTGWGETRGSGFEDELKQSVQVVQDLQNCTHDTDTQICVDEDFHSPCHGDSGGPLVCKLAGRWYLMGATSFGTQGNFMSGLCGMPGAKVVFAKVADKGDWIRQLIDANS